MARKRRIPPPDALLCERCGYDLAGLRKADDCPECGKAVVESVRTLQAPSVVSSVCCEDCGYELTRLRKIKQCPECGKCLDVKHSDSVELSSKLFTSRLTRSETVVLWAQLAASPTKYWDGVTIDPIESDLMRFRAMVYAAVSCCIATFLCSAGGVLIMGFFGCFGLIALMAVCMLLILCLCWIESIGIRFFGQRRGWRVSKDVAMVIVSHASFAWIVSALGIGVVLGLTLIEVIPIDPAFGAINTTMLALFLAFLPGLLWFETLVWIGVRKLRFANIPGSERHLADHGLEARAADAGGDAPVSPDG